MRQTRANPSCSEALITSELMASSWRKLGQLNLGHPDAEQYRPRQCEKSLMHDRTTFLNEGMEAGLDGLTVDTCPYPIHSRERALWIEGWHCASDD